MKNYRYQQLVELISEPGIISDEELKMRERKTKLLNDLLEDGYEIYKAIPVSTDGLAVIKYILRKET